MTGAVARRGEPGRSASRMNPIATYNETRFDGKRTFQLFEDKIVVTGKATLGGDFEIAIPLASLTPSVARSRSRHRLFFGGIWIVIGSWIVAYVVAALSQKAASELHDSEARLRLTLERRDECAKELRFVRSTAAAY
jgi:hypothetical protein